MDEKDWLILKVLSEKLSITQTAQALFMSQPSLSSRINQMENRFRTRIVIRSKKGVEFTPQGEILVKYANSFLQQMRSIEDNISDLAENPGGILRIASTPFFSRRLLPNMLLKFREKHPLVAFDVSTCCSSDAVDKVTSMEVSIAFVRGEYTWRGCGRKLLFKEDIYICAQQPLDLSQLPHLPRIDYVNVHSAQELQDKWWHENYQLEPYVSLRVDNPETCYEMVIKGLGYAFLPTLFLEHHQNYFAQQLKFRNGKPLTRNTWLYYNKNTQDLPSVKLFLDFAANYPYIK